MSRFRTRGVLAALTVMFLAVACSEEPTASSPGASGSPSAAADDLLARVQQDGSLRVATDQKYKPQSWYDAATDEWKGFDVEVAQEIATRLGVEADIAHQDWEQVTAGSWNDRWDMNVGSMTVTKERSELFEFSPAYYFTPASIAVHADNTSIQDTETDLDGKKICVGVATRTRPICNRSSTSPGTRSTT